MSLVSRYGDTAGIVNESSKGYLPFFQSTCSRIMENLIKQVNSKNMGTMVYFTYCEEFLDPKQSHVGYSDNG